MFKRKRYIFLLLLASLFIPRSFLGLFLKKTDYVKSTNGINYEINKSYVDKYKEQCIQALSYYPELENVHIEFREGNIATTMAARPKVSSFFNFKYERKYEVIFNSSDDCEVPFSELSEEGQIGILGHELAHILDYEKKSFGRIILTGAFYINPHSIRRYERSIDKITLERGLGQKLYDAYHYILNESTASLKYKEFKKFHYLEPQEILQRLEK